VTHREIFLAILDRGVRDARIRFEGEGWSATVGRAEAPAPDVGISVSSERFFLRVLREGNLGLGEAYINGDFAVDAGDLETFLTILLRNRIDEQVRRTPWLALRVGAIRLANWLRPRQVNVRQHYDLGLDLFEGFLDSTMTYSCGYARTPEDTLDELQQNKLTRICRKLDLQPGQRLLDIGCGYAGLLMHAAVHHDVRGTGVTNSRQHFEHGVARVRQAGLDGHVTLVLGDYRAVEGRFDRIVSVGMMEHVPPAAYGDYVRTIARRLAFGGLGLVHTIGCSRATNIHDPFIQRYVFPGSGQPRLSDIARHLERNTLSVLDVENIVRHYVYTVRGWLRRYRAVAPTLDPTRYDDGFRRLWEYYLCCGIAAALASPSSVYQVLFTNDPARPLPLQRV
jgi:cyclopropane-fatty-acyl-phospholipid synthase